MLQISVVFLFSFLLFFLLCDYARHPAFYIWLLCYIQHFDYYKINVITNSNVSLDLEKALEKSGWSSLLFQKNKAQNIIKPRIYSRNFFFTYVLLLLLLLLRLRFQFCLSILQSPKKNKICHQLQKLHHMELGDLTAFKATATYCCKSIMVFSLEFCSSCVIWTTCSKRSVSCCALAASSFAVSYCFWTLLNKSYKIITNEIDKFNNFYHRNEYNLRWQLLLSFG